MKRAKQMMFVCGGLIRAPSREAKRRIRVSWIGVRCYQVQQLLSGRSLRPWSEVLDERLERSRQKESFWMRFRRFFRRIASWFHLPRLA
jgi:hypothetical protein